MRSLVKVFLSLFIIFSYGCAKKLVDEDLDVSAVAKSRIDAAMVYIGDGNTRDALRHLKKAEEFEKKSLELFHAYALLYASEDDDEQTRKYFKKALGQDRKNSKVLNNYGMFLCGHESPEKGLKLLTKATGDYQYAGRPEAYVNRGLCERSLGRDKGAEKSFQQALRLNSNSAQPYIELAEIYFDRDEANTSQRYFREYVKRAGGQNARSLWLGIRIEGKAGDQNALSSYVLALQSRFPRSAEYKLYRESLK